MLSVMPSNLLLFGAVARALGAECRRRGLRVPAFRSPPRAADAVRAIRRWPDGGAVVLVRVRGRPVATLVADMVEGVLVANQVEGRRRRQLRAELCLSVGEVLGHDVVAEAQATDAA